MNVRTVTVGLPVERIGELDRLEPAIRETLAALRDDLAADGVSVRTNRVTLSPIGETPERRVNQAHAMGLIRTVGEACERLGIRWFNVPFDFTSHRHSTTLDTLAELAFETLRRLPRSFVNMIVADQGRFSFPAMTRAARIIRSVAGLDTSGYHNFRVGVGCNLRPNTPFFPFAYSSPEPGFSIGLEMPQLLIPLVSRMRGAPLALVREAMIELLVPRTRRIDEAAARASERRGLAYHGIDVSIAPYPEAGGSVAELMELLGIEQYGSAGTLFTTGFLTDVLKELVERSGIRSVGFNGVMFSLLEDDVMGRRNQYGIDSLILYSTVCGCGVDMVPIPGGTFEEEIASIILDVATASTVIGKPLGVRLLPVPMKDVNEMTSFNMDFLFNTRIQRVRGVGFQGRGLAGDAFTFLKQR